MPLNLARAWRSRTFDQVVGQDLCVRMIKNSLYLGHYFPVYLFSGQRGCGKTTMARLFAAAINCQALEQFQINPKEYTLPCLICSSCQAMATNNHPDFIEIDGASHTGVDNVRNIIEAASLLPILGRKRIYLIDEAHMLSKAAFNAFLKILEEPPAHAHFILATTDIAKIVDTVRSRSFQLFFRPIAPTVLQTHLRTICSEEKIPFDAESLQLIIAETGGSVRDALNLLEQVRFSSKRVTKEAVQAVLGHPDDQIIVQLMQLIVTAQEKELIQFLQQPFITQVQPQAIWSALVRTVRRLINIICGLDKDQKEMVKCANHLSLAQCTRMLELLYAYEALFIKTTEPHNLLELLALKLCATQKTQHANPATLPHVPKSHSASPLQTSEPRVPVTSAPSSQDGSKNQWDIFLQQIESLNDPLVSSLFKQSGPITIDQQAGIITGTFAKEFSFFNELLDSTRSVWEPLLRVTFGSTAIFQASFSEQIAKPIITKPIAQQSPTSRSHQSSMNITTQKPVQQFTQSCSRSTKRPTPIREQLVDVSDAHKWPRAQNLLTLFPGSPITAAQDESF